MIFKKAKKPLATGAKSCIMITKEDGNGRSLRFAIKKITVAGGIVGGYLFFVVMVIRIGQKRQNDGKQPDERFPCDIPHVSPAFPLRGQEGQQK